MQINLTPAAAYTLVTSITHTHSYTQRTHSTSMPCDAWIHGRPRHILISTAKPVLATICTPPKHQTSNRCMHLPHAATQTCKGTGVQVMIRPLGPGMVQQMQSRCSACGGAGSAVPPSDTCGGCKGKGLVPEKKTFEITIEPGMKQV